ncbi:hypothetical protein EJB05_47155, partial [Eragrostis curvula]
MDEAPAGSRAAPAPEDAAGEGGAPAPDAPDPAAQSRGAPAPDAAPSPDAADLARRAPARAACSGEGCRLASGTGGGGGLAGGAGGSSVEPRQGSSAARSGTGAAVMSSAGEAGDEVAPGAGSCAAAGSGSHIDEAGSSFTGRDASQPQMTINFRVPGYIAYLDDGSRVEFENIDHIVELNETDGYTMSSLVADLARKTKWGTCQDPVFWYWDFEKKGLQIVVSNEDLRMVFQKFQIWGKRFSFVVEFPLKPAYKSSISIEAKMEKLPVRRNPHLPRESRRGRHTPRGSHKGPR